MVVAEWVLLTLSFASGGGPCRQAAIPRGQAGRAVPWPGSGWGQRDFSASRLRPATPRAGIGLSASGEPPELVELDELLQAAITKAAASPAGTSHTLFITDPPVPPLRADSRLPDLQLHSCPPTCSPTLASSLGRLRLSHRRLCSRRLAWRADEILCKAFWAGQPGRQPQRPDPTGQPSRSEITRRPRNQNRPIQQAPRPGGRGIADDLCAHTLSRSSRLPSKNPAISQQAGPKSDHPQ